MTAIFMDAGPADDVTRGVLWVRRGRWSTGAQLPKVYGGVGRADHRAGCSRRLIQPDVTGVKAA
jgi:hypothetical protein